MFARLLLAGQLANSSHRVVEPDEIARLVASVAATITGANGVVTATVTRPR